MTLLRGPSGKLCRRSWLTSAPTTRYGPARFGCIGELTVGGLRQFSQSTHCLVLGLTTRRRTPSAPRSMRRPRPPCPRCRRGWRRARQGLEVIARHVIDLNLEPSCLARMVIDTHCVPASQFSRVALPQMTVANSSEIDGRITILYHCMATLTVYLLKVANLRTVDRHLRYPGKLRSAFLGSYGIL